MLGIFLTEGAENDELDKILGRLAELQEKGDAVEVEGEVELERLLPPNRSYFTYPGSLTTPPLHESVTWLVFRQPLSASPAQLRALRQMQTGTGAKKKCLVNNFRPPCHSGDRVVKFRQV